MRPCPRVHASFVVLVLALFAVALLAGREVATLLSTSCASLVLAHQVLGRRVHERAWAAVLVGMAVLTIDAANSVVAVVVQGRPEATGLIASSAMPLGYLALLVGAIMLVSPPGRRDLGAVLDATLVTVTGTILLWSVLLGPHLADIGATPGQSLQPLVIVVLLGAISGALLRTWLVGHRPGALGYVLLGVLAAYLGNVVKVLTWTPTDMRSSWWIVFFWVVGYAAVATGSLHPSAEIIAAPPVDDRLTSSRIVWLGVALLVAPTTAALQDLGGEPIDGTHLVATTIVVVPLVLARVALLARLHACAEERLRHLAQYDELTGVANRRAGTARLQEALTRVTGGRSPGVAVAFADIDGFKSINDDLGHPAGDRVLAELATRLTERLRASDAVARFGGDEFVIVCEGDPDSAEARVRDVLAAALADPIDVGSQQLTCRASVGTSVVRPGDATTVDEVLSAADTQMYRHKARYARG